MESFNGGKSRNQLSIVIFIVFVFSFFLFYFDSSTLVHSKNVVQSMIDYVHSVSGVSPMPKWIQQPVGHVIKEESKEEVEQLHGQAKGRPKPVVKENKSEFDPCSGKYIYVYDLPSKFNYDLLKECGKLSSWSDMCRELSNGGFGPRLANSAKTLTRKGWFATNQFALSVIFHSRMKQYKCLTSNSSLASAIYVPFYPGLDVARYLWGFNTTIRDSTSHSLIQWLGERPEWKALGGKDHFMVAGRITWDFRRDGDNETYWGNDLLFTPEGKNMTMLLIESSPWHGNDIAIPYPTYFHPSTEEEVFQWESKLRKQKKKTLFSFAGSPRPNQVNSIRSKIIEQCKGAKGKCKLLGCAKGEKNCHSPENVMKLFRNSVFCLQPPGDSYTRKSAFDSMLAGCIPVFFHPGSAYVQYTWHLPRNFTSYSVLIPEDDVREENVSISSILSRIPNKDVRAMREEVIRLIPKLIYAHPKARMERIEDAFDVAIKGVIERTKAMKEGLVSNISFAGSQYWKYNLFGTEEEHEWDHFFSSTTTRKTKKRKLSSL